MSSYVEAVRASQALDHVHSRLQQQENHQFDEDIMRMKHVLNSPLLRQLLAIQASCKELNHKIITAKGDTINDFEFSPDRGLIAIPNRHLKLDQNRSSVSVDHSYGGNRIQRTEDSHKSKGEPSFGGFEDERGDLIQHLVPVAEGREMETIVLSKPEKGGLGFSVVGLKSENKGELGIFIQDVQSDGIAAR